MAVPSACVNKWPVFRPRRAKIINHGRDRAQHVIRRTKDKSSRIITVLEWRQGDGDCNIAQLNIVDRNAMIRFVTRLFR